MRPLETYLTSLREIRSSGEAVDETSYYGALESFLNEVGKSLKPRVRCVLQLKNRGAGMPDGGLFTEDQLKNPRAKKGPYRKFPLAVRSKLSPPPTMPGSRPRANKSAAIGEGIAKSSLQTIVISFSLGRMRPASR